jgi:hypothetical protein
LREARARDPTAPYSHANKPVRRLSSLNLAAYRSNASDEIKRRWRLPALATMLVCFSQKAHGCSYTITVSACAVSNMGGVADATTNIAVTVN